MFFTSLAIPIFGVADNKFAFLPITFVLSGIVVQAILLRRFRSSQGRQLRLRIMRPKETAVVETKACRYCDRAIAADAKICKLCLTEVDEYSLSAAQVASQAEIRDLQLQNERWRAATNANL
jgi:hypothetical protein